MPSVTLKKDSPQPGAVVMLAPVDAGAIDLRQLDPSVVITRAKFNWVRKAQLGIHTVSLNHEDGTTSSILVDEYGRTTEDTPLQLYVLGRRNHRRTVFRLDFTSGQVQVH